MKTIETLAAILAASREEYRATATAARQAVRDLETVYRETIEGTPAETIAAYVEHVGYDTAVSTIATLVNRSASDGRISRRCAEWAAAQEEAFDAEAAERLWLYSDRIHKAHLEQLAAAMMEYSPKQPEEAEEAEEEPEEETPALLPRVAEILAARRNRSAWARGVAEYAAELLEKLTERAEWEGREPWNVRELERWMLNGAADWQQYSEGGCAMICNRQIAERLCTPSELKKTNNGQKDPNPRETWINCQARALCQAAQIVREAWTQAEEEV